MFRIMVLYIATACTSQARP